ncbi:uncharacterized protein LOC113297293 [Papaver somniferum]|uniref:uncharacterized protein LOC113297293 n=1 Tax=Papaver somniferum TaxID=3469 RepID=UPI000E6F4A2C|nr:uncharacterized protein LOC113297293 [Papaver somniferum]
MSCYLSCSIMQLMCCIQGWEERTWMDDSRCSHSLVYLPRLRLPQIKFTAPLLFFSFTWNRFIIDPISTTNTATPSKPYKESSNTATPSKPYKESSNNNTSTV